MRQLLCISVVAFSLCISAYAESNFVDRSPAVPAASQALLEKYPVKGWKRVGIIQGKKPLISFLVPPFFRWEDLCERLRKRNNIEFCELSESTPFVVGEFESSGIKRTLSIHVVAYFHSKAIPPYSYKTGFSGMFGRFGSLRSNEDIELGGKQATRAEIEDSLGKSPKQIKAQTLIKFNRTYVGGMIYFIETDRGADGEKFAYLDERVFKPVIEQVIKSFKYEVDPDKLGK